MEQSQESQSVWKRLWKWIVGGLTALVAVAGFASPEFRAATCLDLPSTADLQYPPEGPGATSFSRISTQSQQKALDGQKLTFRARYYGETLASIYAPVLGPEKQQGYAFLNLRPLDFVAQDTPLGSTASEFPKALVLLPSALAAELSVLRPGQIIEIDGVGHWLSSPESGAPILLQSPNYPVGDYNDFYVLASDASVLVPENSPNDRILCKLFHDLDS